MSTNIFVHSLNTIVYKRSTTLVAAALLITPRLPDYLICTVQAQRKAVITDARKMMK
eukprot:SAG31_NODE_6274_length_2093_cov_2.302407_5_plen_56_part_01